MTTTNQQRDWNVLVWPPWSPGTTSVTRMYQCDHHDHHEPPAWPQCPAWTSSVTNMTTTNQQRDWNVPVRPPCPAWTSGVTTMTPTNQQRDLNVPVLYCVEVLCTLIDTSQVVALSSTILTSRPIGRRRLISFFSWATRTSFPFQPLSSHHWICLFVFLILYFHNTNKK